SIPTPWHRQTPYRRNAKSGGPRCKANPACCSRCCGLLSESGVTKICSLLYLGRMSDILYRKYTISTDKSRLDVGYIHRYISDKSYWARHIPVTVINTCIENSFCVGAYHGEQQVGFGRLITDYATFG